MTVESQVAPFVSRWFSDQRAPPVAQTVRNPPAMQETQVRSLGREDPLEKGRATHSSTLAWRSPWTQEPGGPQSTGSQRAQPSLGFLRTHHVCVPPLLSCAFGGVGPQGDSPAPTCERTAEHQGSSQKNASCPRCVRLSPSGWADGMGSSQHPT